MVCGPLHSGAAEWLRGPPLFNLSITRGVLELFDGDLLAAHQALSSIFRLVKLASAAAKEHVTDLERRKQTKLIAWGRSVITVPLV